MARQSRQGFRNIVARKYQVGGGSSGAVDAEKINGPVNSVPFLSALPSSSCQRRDQRKKLRNKPGYAAEELRARGRTVAIADYEVLALTQKARRLSGRMLWVVFIPRFPGALFPELFCVFVVPAKRGIGRRSPLKDSRSCFRLSKARICLLVEW